MLLLLPGGRGREGRKVFFSEEKKQKTFDYLASALLDGTGAKV
jgi:hypothetical protein